MPSPINIHYVSLFMLCSFHCIYCVCPHGAYGLLSVGMKVSESETMTCMIWYCITVSRLQTNTNKEVGLL